jgi:hypothetical protein
LLQAASADEIINSPPRFAAPAGAMCPLKGSAPNATRLVAINDRLDWPPHRKARFGEVQQSRVGGQALRSRHADEH